MNHITARDAMYTAHFRFLAAMRAWIKKVLSPNSVARISKKASGTAVSITPLFYCLVASASRLLLHAVSLAKLPQLPCTLRYPLLLEKIRLTQRAQASAGYLSEQLRG
mmetsp:Transcript_5362/g.9864  ORF Transcript_5362/g.9864 Transcript_5362/m.9864 type:complete len:108 (-) Transcript_5362:1477-1800(-)